VRWVGHALHAELRVVLAGSPTFEESQEIVGAVRRSLLKDIRHLSELTVETVAAPAVASSARSLH
jgi:hypothetical protein